MANRKLGDVCEFINGGAWKESEYSDNGIHVVKVTNIVAGEIVKRQDDSYLPDSKHDKYQTHELREGDIVVATVGSHPTQPGSVVGRTTRVNHTFAGSFLNQNAVCLRFPQAGEICSEYFAYLTKTILFKHHIESRAKGSANQVRMGIGELKKYEHNFPALSIQNRIAAILRAYDDLIENNKRRITLLEKMAEEIYREWFVRFRFPGWKEAEFEKGLPVGWAHQKLAEAFDFTGGGTPSKDNDSYWRNGDVDWYTPSDITRSNSLFMASSEFQCNEEGLRRSSAKLFPAYSVMMTSRATIGAIGINTKPACTNQGFITCVPNEQYPLTYLYHWLKTAKPHFEILSGGATFPELIKSTFKRIEILSPDQSVVEKFDGLVSPMFKQLESLSRQNRKLEQTKNQLLPRLISGKLSVENLDIQFPPSMQNDKTESPVEAVA
ncbi:restriction endonuclease subunit S [Marinobacter sp.]|uniref:restriction endonuclease subunit S n=1 Tax=Marinobacter sp. TaxID=50741 RepID=UPI003A913B97